MPQISYRANLSAAISPLFLVAAGQTVIVPGQDNTYDKRVDPEGTQKNAGIPQVLYMEDVIPTMDGYQSVGYQRLYSLPLPVPGTFAYRVEVIGEHVYVFFMGGEEKVFRSALGDHTIWADYTATWNTLFGPPYVEGYLPYNNLSTATVRGTTYMYVRNGQTLASLSSGVWTDVSGTITGIAATDIQCIAGSYNYLIAVLDDGTVAHSSTTNPLDFTISLVSGAGSARPTSQRTPIVAVHTCPEGFILYTKDTAILAQYTGNARYPWKFVEISGSAGTDSERKLAAPVDAAAHILIDAHGTIRSVSASGAKVIAPEVSTYLRKQRVPNDSYNQATNQFASTAAVLRPYEINYILNRYVILFFDLADIAASVDVRRDYVMALVYDTTTGRYGRLKGSCAFIWTHGAGVYGVSLSGDVQRVVFDIYDVSVLTTSPVFSSVLVLGKFKYVRSRRIEIQAVTLTGELSDVKVALIPSSSGGTFDPGQELTNISFANGEIVTYRARTEGDNVSVAVKGRFDLASLALTFTPGGGR